MPQEGKDQLAVQCHIPREGVGSWLRRYTDVPQVFAPEKVLPTVPMCFLAGEGMWARTHRTSSCMLATSVTTHLGNLRNTPPDRCCLCDPESPTQESPLLGLQLQGPARTFNAEKLSGSVAIKLHFNWILHQCTESPDKHDVLAVMEMRTRKTVRRAERTSTTPSPHRPH